MQENNEAQENLVVHAYNPKDRREIRKVFNNIYVKNFPLTWDEAKLRSLFSQFGHITSLCMNQIKRDGEAEPSAFAFVCYGSPDGTDNEAGPASAERAV